MATRPAIPDRADDISARWMRHALDAGGVPNTESLADVVIEDVSDGHGLFCETKRCRLVWFDNPALRPQTVIVKLSKSDPDTSGYARKAQLHRREYDYYRYVASYSPIRSPGLIYANVDRRNYRSVLVLEDVGNTERSEGEDSASPEQIKIATRAAAGLHGMYWNQVDQPPASRFPDFWQRHPKLVQLSYLIHLPAALDRLSGLFSDDMRRLAEAYGPRIADHIDEIAAGPRTLTHGDYQSANMMFSGQFTVIDWQNCGIRNGLFDVVQFLASSVAPEIRRDTEREALEAYCDALHGAGVNNFTLDDCWTSYRRIMLSRLIGPVVIFGSLDLPNDGIRQRVETRLRRSLIAIQDLDAEEFLPNRRRIFWATNTLTKLSRAGYRARRALHRI